MTDRVYRMIDALTGEPFDAAKMWAELIEEARQRLLAEGKTTWPNGRSLWDGHPFAWPFSWTPPGEQFAPSTRCEHCRAEERRPGRYD